MSKTIEELRADAQRIKNETGEGKNTATRVGGLFEDIVDIIDDYHGGDGSRPAPEPDEGNAVLYEPQNASDYEKVAALNNLHGKAYNAAKKSGLGKVYLDKNNGLLTQAMMNAANTCYVIMYDYDLDGEEIQVPEGCVLEFDGGSVSNGKLISNRTEIVGLLPEGNNVFHGVYFRNGIPMNHNLKERKDYTLGLLSGFLAPGERFSYKFYPQGIVGFHFNNAKYWLLGGNIEGSSPEKGFFVLLDEYFDYKGSAAIPGASHGGGLAVCDGKLYHVCKRETSGNNGVAVFNISTVVSKCLEESATPHSDSYSELSRSNFITLDFNPADIAYDSVNEEFILIDMSLGLHVFNKEFEKIREFTNSCYDYISSKTGLGGMGCTYQGIAFRNGIAYLANWLYTVGTGGTASSSAVIVQLDTINNVYTDLQCVKAPYARGEVEGISFDPDDDNVLYTLFGAYFNNSSVTAIARISQVGDALGINSISGNDNENFVSPTVSVRYYIDNTYRFQNGMSTGQGNKPFKSIEAAVVMAITNSKNITFLLKGSNTEYSLGEITVGAGMSLLIMADGPATVRMLGRIDVDGRLTLGGNVTYVCPNNRNFAVRRNGILMLSGATLNVSSSMTGIYVYDMGIVKLESGAINGGYVGIQSTQGTVRGYGVTFTGCTLAMTIGHSFLSFGTLTFANCGAAVVLRNSDMKAEALHFSNCEACFDVDDSLIDIPLSGVDVTDCTHIVRKNDATFRSNINLMFRVNSLDDFSNVIAFVKKGQISNTGVGFRVSATVAHIRKGVYYYNDQAFISQGTGLPITTFDSTKALVPNGQATLADMPTLYASHAGVRFFNTDINKYMYWTGQNWVVEGGLLSEIGEIGASSTVFDGHAVAVSQNTYTSDWEGWTHGTTVYSKVFEITGNPFTKGDIVYVKIEDFDENHEISVLYYDGDTLVAPIIEATNYNTYNKSVVFGFVPEVTASNSLKLEILVNSDVEYYTGKVKIYKVV